jgi:hypothetical protein
MFHYVWVRLAMIQPIDRASSSEAVTIIAQAVPGKQDETLSSACPKSKPGCGTLHGNDRRSKCRIRRWNQDQHLNFPRPAELAHARQHSAYDQSSRPPRVKDVQARFCPGTAESQRADLLRFPPGCFQNCKQHRQVEHGSCRRYKGNDSTYVQESQVQQICIPSISSNGEATRMDVAN